MIRYSARFNSGIEATVFTFHNTILSGNSVAMRVLQMLSQRTSYAYMLTGIDNLRNGELSARGYAAQGGVRLDGSLQPMAGEKSLLRVNIQIPEGWHINSHQPNSKDLIPTELKLPSESDQWQMAPVTYPKHSMQKLAFQSEPLAATKIGFSYRRWWQDKANKPTMPRCPLSSLSKPATMKSVFHRSRSG